MTSQPGPWWNRGFGIKGDLLMVAALVVIGGFLWIKVGCACDFSNTAGKSNVSTMKSDLRNLVTSEESYFADHHRYTARLSDLQYAVSPGVRPPVIVVADTSWSATITHTQLVGVPCGIAVGGATNPIVASAGEGEPACRVPWKSRP